MTEENVFAQVVFPLPLSQSFDYTVPSHLKEKVAIGERVLAPFGKRLKVGYIVGLSKKSGLPRKMIRPIRELIDESPLLDERLLRLSKMIQSYYLCSWGEALEAILPGALRPRKRGSRGIPVTEETPPLPESSLEAPSPLSGNQTAVFKKIATLNRRTRKPFLLLEGSEGDKTELVLQLIQKFLEKDFSSIVLYPEISLTQEVSHRYRHRFGENVCVVHSRISPLDRYEIWKSLKEGICRVVVGVRSAILSPVRRLGLMVLFEENDTHYKQEEVPRYHARTVALMRSELEGATLLLESETPSLESYAKALEKSYTLLRLPKEKAGKSLPKTSTVDMREEFSHQRRKTLLSKYLERRMAAILKEKGQTLLFLNRRGFSTFIHCRRCGTTVLCPGCHLPMKYHFEPRRLICHTCNAQNDPPNVCPACRESYLQYSGVGTERVESEVHRLFPEARIIRVDTDAVRRSGSFERLIAAFRQGEGDVLIGTQILAREIVHGGIPLVGILSADTLLNTSDFRSAEHAFTTLHRFIRQAKREEEGGEVVIQTFSPQHHAILASRAQDYQAFYDHEIRSRKALGFPPYRTLARITFRGKVEERVASASQSFKKRLNRYKKGEGISFVGPAPAPRLVRGEYQWQLLVKSEKGHLPEFLGEALKRFKMRAAKLIVDIDPY